MENMFASPSQSRVWIDPERSPFVHNSCSARPRNRFVEPLGLGPARAADGPPEPPQSPVNYLNEEDDFRGDNFLLLPEGAVDEGAVEHQYIVTDTGALKQLTSPNTQSDSKQTAILLRRHKSECDQTIQEMAVGDRSTQSVDGIHEEDADGASVTVSPSTSGGKPAGGAGGARADRDTLRRADEVIAKVMSNEVFLLKPDKTRRDRKRNKVCEVCQKAFDRISDLKRHLIEHVVRSSLAKSAAGGSGAPSLPCEVCRAASFARLDHYKAHLRAHAKLTLYKCTFCDKCFSDSSNFAKHKKLHSAIYFQCDLCGRKFNTKKMITQHMEYHDRHAPVPCSHCGKCFHFESTLRKHINQIHRKRTAPGLRCRFCLDKFVTMKEKWDHEWLVHSFRKLVFDCSVCDVKFRKYSELKRHCIDTHEMEIPLAKKLLSDNQSGSE